MARTSELRQLLTSGRTLVMPDAYDPISARIIERLGFKAVQCSGYSFALAASKEQGISDAIDRANRYLEGGADLAFVTGVATLEQVRLLVKEISGPVSIAAGLPFNIRNSSIAELQDCGVARVSLPTVAVLSAIVGMIRCLESIRDCDGFSEVVAQDLVCSPDRLSSLLAP